MNNIELDVAMKVEEAFYNTSDPEVHRFLRNMGESVRKNVIFESKLPFMALIAGVFTLGMGYFIIRMLGDNDG